MSSIKKFIAQINQKKGGHIMVATLLGRLINFIITVAIVRILASADYGNIAYASGINTLLMPLMGGGIIPSMLRYGALSKGQLEKKYFIRHTLKIGSYISLFFIFAIWLLTPFLTQKLPEAGIFLALYAVQLIGLLFFKGISTYCMLIHRNELFAQTEITLSLSWLVFNILGAFLFGGLGYLISSVGLPFLVGAYYWHKLNLSDYKAGLVFKFNNKTLLSYGFYTSIGGFLSSFLYSMDVLLIGNLLENPTLIAQYRTASIIPLNMIILSNAIISANMVSLARNANHEPSYLGRFYINYLKIFLPLSLIAVVFFYFAADYVMLFFGEEYLQQSALVPVFALGAAGGMLIRVPLGNMLPIMGFPQLNALFSLIILLLNFIGSYWAIQSFGIIGAAGITALLFWFSGLLSLSVFLWWLSKNKKRN